jgi:hypothetical protein
MGIYWRVQCPSCAVLRLKREDARKKQEHQTQNEHHQGRTAFGTQLPGGQNKRNSWAGFAALFSGVFVGRLSRFCCPPRRQSIQAEESMRLQYQPGLVRPVLICATASPAKPPVLFEVPSGCQDLLGLRLESQYP